MLEVCRDACWVSRHPPLSGLRDRAGGDAHTGLEELEAVCQENDIANPDDTTYMNFPGASGAGGAGGRAYRGRCGLDSDQPPGPLWATWTPPWHC